MESEKVKEIKKALENCASNEIVNKLPYIDDHECKAVAFEDILTLINELESENERLKHLNNSISLGADLHAESYKQEITELEEETQQLKDRIAELEKENAKYKQKLTTNQWVQEIRNESLKQFAERLKMKAIRRQEFIGELAIDDIEYVKTKDIDKTLKEFIDVDK